MSKGIIWASSSEIQCEKVRLHKKTEVSPVFEFNKLLFNKAMFILFIVFAIIVFCAICRLITGISATESGLLRNFINGGYI